MDTPPSSSQREPENSSAVALHGACSGATLVADSGKGRACVFLHEKGEFGVLVQKLHLQVSQQTRSVVIELAPITESSWRPVTENVFQVLAQAGVRQASIVGCGAGASVALNVALTDLKLVRSLVLIEAALRPHPSWRSKLVDRIERTLPLGLPLRSQGDGFDAKPFLHRLRCPALVVSGVDSGTYLTSQASMLEAGLPSAWHLVVSAGSVEQGSGSIGDQIGTAILDFQSVPAKCPQKNSQAQKSAVS